MNSRYNRGSCGSTSAFSGPLIAPWPVTHRPEISASMAGLGEIFIIRDDAAR